MRNLHCSDEDWQRESQQFHPIFTVAVCLSASITDDQAPDCELGGRVGNPGEGTRS
jgi:hypothetical protein